MLTEDQPRGREAVLRFPLPEEEKELSAAMNGMRFHSTMWEVDQQMRQWLKYGPDDLTARQVAEYVRERLADDLYRVYE